MATPLNSSNFCSSFLVSIPLREWLLDEAWSAQFDKTETNNKWQRTRFVGIHDWWTNAADTPYSVIVLWKKQTRSTNS